eukprot:GDKI01026581.1.p1 GENE.GDKI01026581.1~~GDKI01026581.1.p1  ORF type:complete len:303 (-),score=71.16 GDKI01026581.1:48-956(-)
MPAPGTTDNSLSPLSAVEVCAPTAKQVQSFRTYVRVQGDPKSERVYAHYREQHEKMTYDFTLQKKKEYGCLDVTAEYTPKLVLTIQEMLHKMDFYDPSDPDFENNNLYHAYQTAERAREAYPTERWLHFAALVHDLGKLLYLFKEPDWAVCGDIFPVGCAFATDKIVHGETFTTNPDMMHPIYSTECGVYTPKCGLMNTHMGWGHDEYLYQMLKRADREHNLNLDPRILYVVRFHSFYPWHDARAYTHLESEEDTHMLPWVQKFQKLDLYSKDDNCLPDCEHLLFSYYSDLIKEFCPVPLKM